MKLLKEQKNVRKEGKNGFKGWTKGVKESKNGFKESVKFLELNKLLI